MIKACSKCSDYRSDAAAFQDTTYGKGQRVFNKRKDGGYRCTVCENTTGADKAPEKK